jgi:acetone carboxylase gamma subunit
MYACDKCGFGTAILGDFYRHIRDERGVTLHEAVRIFQEMYPIESEPPGTFFQIEYHCPDCGSITPIVPGMTVCVGCQKPLLIVAVEARR